MFNCAVQEQMYRAQMFFLAQSGGGGVLQAPGWGPGCLGGVSGWPQGEPAAQGQGGPGAFEGLAPAGGEGDVMTWSPLPEPESGRRNPLSSPRMALELLRDNFFALAGQDSRLLGRADLAAALDNRALAPEVRNAAAKALQDPFLFRTADGSQRFGKEDGKVSLDDLETTLEARDSEGRPWVPETDRGQEARRHLETVLSSFDTVEKLGKDGRGKGNGDGVIGVGEFESLADDPGLSQELRDAARFFQENPYYYSAMDNARDGNFKDGKVVKGDVEAALMQLGGPLPSADSGLLIPQAVWQQQY